MIDTPPSLHKYLYAYQNPTLWWDPDGRTAALTRAVRWMRDKADLALESIDEESTKDQVIKTGLAVGFLRVGADITSGFNWATNLTAITLMPNTKVGREAQDELERAGQRTRQAINRGVELFVEDPGGTVMGVLEGPDRLAVDGLNKVIRAAAGDKRAQAELIATGMEVGAAAVPLASLGRARQAQRAVDALEVPSGAGRPIRGDAPSTRSSAGASMQKSCQATPTSTS